MYFNIFSKDPRNPWLKRTALTRYGHMRWRSFLLAGLTGIIVGGGYFSYRDATFLAGSRMTAAQFNTISGSGMTHDRYNVPIQQYDGLYTYQVDGQDYSVTSTQNSKDFRPTVNVVYKTSDPSIGTIIYSATPEADLIRIVAGIVVLSVIWYFITFTIIGGWVIKRR